MAYKIDVDEKDLEIEISENFNIYDVLSFKNDVVNYLENKTFVKLELINIENIDTAGVQVLISLIKTCRTKKIEYVIKGNDFFFNYLNSLGSNLESFFKNSGGGKKNA